MEQPHSEIHSLDGLAAAVARLEERVATLERGQEKSVPAARTAPATKSEAAAAPVGKRWLDVALVGRSLIILGVGYLLRAITDLGIVTIPLGGAAGLALATALLAFADRAGARGRAASAVFHATTALLIAYPLIGELELRFGLIGSALSATLIVAIGAAALVVAERRHLAALAWVVVIGTVLVAVALAVQSRDLLPYAALLTALTAGAGWFGRSLGQRFLVWPVALVTDLLLLFCTQLVLWGRSPGSPWGTAVVALGFFVVCAGGNMARAIHDRTATTPWEMLQSALAFLIGFVSAARLAAGLDAGAALGVAMLALGIGGAVLALRAFVPWTAGRTLAFWTSLALAVVLTSLTVLIRGPGLAIVDALPAAALLLLARRLEHPLAELQAVVTLAVAAFVSGLLGDVALGLVAAPPDVVVPGPVALLVLVLFVLAAVAGVREPPAGAPIVRRAAKAVAVLFTTVCVAGVLAAVAIVAAHPSRAITTTVRTGILSLGAIGLAAAAHHPAGRSVAILVYPLLALTACKMVIEDLPYGVAATLFASLALFGLALIVAPRLAKASAVRLNA